ncbi:carboxylesterase [Nocardia seriolae]|uniref:Carboxylic ester hydrolase n=1 Tax=Nocardia seriolae TaxID=37332 RepID=A0ABC9YY84_9NOCA|nr:carboxylesterase [Nocardia seriolae]GEM24631.1 carboxylic ester hydrolase [Nocardia seriolae NBRC 15557]BEK85612.1 carboxylesterase/lipase family protein [Nocardia seriolae]BEK98561.1 carboxylesterase/lipase family protein [Nocardia seriolae]GAM48386.1 carboxylesterase [Nocardia seriolae]
MSTRFFDTPSGSNDTPSGRAGVPVAKTGSGEVAGSLDGRIAVWRGIPYAASVGGPNRFRTPQPPLAWTGVRDCTDFGDVAPQSPGFVPVDGSLRMGEDCLWLNVWAPADPSDELRPVMVWLHGGAFCLGTAAQAIYDGKRLAETGDVIVVGVNYRLGALGFLDLSSLGDEFVPNLGLHDQIAALRWVRDNAAAFGGDPGNVTVFGESSGAGCVTALLTSPLSAGLFHRAIAQSPPATTVFGPERAALVAKRYLELLEITPDRAVELLTMPVERIIAAAGTLLDEVPLREPGRLAAAPVVDGNLLPAYPSERFQQGRSHRVPLIIGTNRDEASLFRLFRSPIMPVTPDAVNEMLRGVAAEHPGLSPERLAEIAAAYEATTARGALTMSTDAAFRMPSHWVADAHSAHSPTWMYRFDHATPMLKAARVGAGHATELPYVFGNFGSFEYDPTFWLGGRKAAQDVSGRMMRRWLAFAGYGVPAAIDGSKHWRPYDAAARPTLVIDAVDRMVDDPDRDRNSIWGDDVVGFY